MDIGIGLPTTIDDVDGARLVAWARRSDELGFSTLGVIDRVVYHNYEPLTALAAAAAVTERIRLATTILIAPLHTNAVLLAKQAATIDHLSGGRLTLGLAAGAREDDFSASGVDFHRRGRTFDDQLAQMRRVWAGEPYGFAGAVGPRPVGVGGPELVFGGRPEAAFPRMTEHGSGWIAGGVTPEMFADAAVQARDAWASAGRSGSPRLRCLGYFSLGPDAEEAAHRSIGHYYAWLGDTAGHIAASALRTEQQVQGAVAAFEKAGCDELILFPAAADPLQVELLAEAAGLS